MAKQAQKWRTPTTVHCVDNCEPSRSNSTGGQNLPKLEGGLKRHRRWTKELGQTEITLNNTSKN